MNGMASKNTLYWGNSMEQEAEDAIKLLAKMGITPEQYAEEMKKTTLWIPANGQAVLTGDNDFPRISTGKLDEFGWLLCYYDDGDTVALETWKPAKHIPSVLNKIPHDGSDVCPIADGIEHIVKYKNGNIRGGKVVSQRDWPEVEWYASLKGEI